MPKVRHSTASPYGQVQDSRNTGQLAWHSPSAHQDKWKGVTCSCHLTSHMHCDIYIVANILLISQTHMCTLSNYMKDSYTTYTHICILHMYMLYISINIYYSLAICMCSRSCLLLTGWTHLFLCVKGVRAGTSAPTSPALCDYSMVSLKNAFVLGSLSDLVLL